MSCGITETRGSEVWAEYLNVSSMLSHSSLGQSSDLSNCQTFGLHAEALVSELPACGCDNALSSVPLVTHAASSGMKAMHGLIRSMGGGSAPC